MKKLIILSYLLVSSAVLTFAQWGSSGTSIYNTNAGNVGIRLSDPVYPMQIWDGGANNYSGIGFIPGTTVNENAVIKALKNTGFGLLLRADNQDAGQGQVAIHLKNSNQSAQGKVTVMSNFIDFRTGLGYADNITGENFGTSALYINNSQQVGIGTSNPGTFKLAVEGAIGARVIKVTMQNPWPDYVFSKEYALPTLSDLEKYINENKHLPGIPSAKQVAAEGGIDVGAMNAKLLEKVEELTLYLIELKKENVQIQEENKRISAELKKIASK